MLQILRNKKALCIVLGVCVVLAVALSGILPFAGDQHVTAGQTIVVTVTAGSLEDMYGYQFHMNYDKNEFEYVGGLSSKINDITWIFAKPFDGYELVGATMIGDSAGISGKNTAICQMTFTVKKDGNLSDMSLSMSSVNVVKSDLTYEEDLTDWKYKVAVEK